MFVNVLNTVSHLALSLHDISELHNMLCSQRSACKLRIVVCGGCEAEMQACRLRAHLRFDCPKRLVACGGADTVKLQAERRLAHDNRVCLLFACTCEYMCMD